MFFYASKIFALLLFPYPLFLLIACVALFRLKRGRFRAVYAVALGGIIALSSSTVSGQLIGLLEDRYPRASVAAVGPADVVVVLAGMVNPLTGDSDRPEFLESADRILAGEELVRAGRARHLLISGGSGLMLQTGESEAEILTRWLRARNFPAQNLFVEGDSRNTAENAIQSASIIRGQGWRSVILVTSAFHMPRSVGCFRRAGIEVTTFPVDYYRHRVFAGPEELVPSIGGLRLSTTALKEFVGIAAYWMRGYI